MRSVSGKGTGFISACEHAIKSGFAGFFLFLEPLLHFSRECWTIVTKYTIILKKAFRGAELEREEDNQLICGCLPID